jgi:hypothetical protein
MQTSRGGRRGGGLRLSVVGDDPSHDGTRFSTRCQDRSALDYVAARAVWTGQARDQSADCVFVH